jgi:hypothetical protein
MGGYRPSVGKLRGGYGGLSAAPQPIAASIRAIFWPPDNATVVTVAVTGDRCSQAGRGNGSAVLKQLARP